MSRQRNAYSSVSCMGAIIFGLSFIFLGSTYFWAPCAVGITLMIIGGIGAARYRRCRDEYVCTPCPDEHHTYIAVPQPYYQAQAQPQPYTFVYPTESYMQPQAGQPVQPYYGQPAYQTYPPPYAPQH